MTQDEINTRISELEATYRQTEDVINHPADHSAAKVDAAIRYLAGCGTELARMRNMRPTELWKPPMSCLKNDVEPAVVLTPPAASPVDVSVPR